MITRINRIIFFKKLAGKTLSLLLNTSTIDNYLHDLIRKYPKLSEDNIKQIMIETAKIFFKFDDKKITTAIKQSSVEDILHEILHIAVDDIFDKAGGHNYRLSSLLDEIFISKIVDQDIDSWRQDYEESTLEWLWILIKDKSVVSLSMINSKLDSPVQIELLKTIKILNQEADKLTPEKKNIVKRTIQQVFGANIDYLDDFEDKIAAYQFCKLFIKELTNKIDILTPFYSEKVESKLKMFFLLLKKRLSEAK